MTHESQQPQNLFAKHEVNAHDSFREYVQGLSQETIAQMSRPDSQEVFQVMERNIIGLIGNLPPEHFDVTISTSRENLGRLLASAMMSGYFLRNAEQRLSFEQSLQSMDSVSESSDE